MIRLIKKYGLVMLVFGLVLAAVLFRAFSWSGFRYDASEWAEASKDGHNIVYFADKEKTVENSLTVDMGPAYSTFDGSSGKHIRISPDSILAGDNFNLIRKHKGPVILKSSDPAIAARVWMIISQKGIKNVFILRDSADLQK